MKVLILGGSHFVGRALVESALAAGHQVDVVNRGETGHHVEGASLLRADRTDTAALEDALEDRSWDSVIDTWAGPPTHASSAARLLGPRTSHYACVSSRSVYQWPIEIGLDESHPVVDADRDDRMHEDYAAAKRGGELGVLAARPDALVARAGLILGPHEDVGRLPWWLGRISRGGTVLAPGPPTRRLQYIDARDLAEWMLGCAARGVSGVFNAVSPVGHTTMGDLLQAVLNATGATAELVWLTPEQIEDAGLSPWTELPIWVPPTGALAGLHNCDSSAARQTGLTCRPIEHTVHDTWTWIRAEGQPALRIDRPTHGIAALREAEILARLID